MPDDNSQHYLQHLKTSTTPHLASIISYTRRECQSKCRFDWKALCYRWMWRNCENWTPETQNTSSAYTVVRCHWHCFPRACADIAEQCFRNAPSQWRMVAGLRTSLGDCGIEKPSAASLNHNTITPPHLQLISPGQDQVARTCLASPPASNLWSPFDQTRAQIPNIHPQPPSTSTLTHHQNPNPRYQGVEGKRSTLPP